MKTTIYVRKAYLNAEADWILILRQLSSKIIWLCEILGPFLYAFITVKCFWLQHHVILLVRRQKWTKTASAVALHKSQHYWFGALGIKRMQREVSLSFHSVTCGSKQALSILASGSTERSPSPYHHCCDTDPRLAGGQQKSTSKIPGLTHQVCILWPLFMLAESCNSSSVQEKHSG